jgi:small subunit ribosomal protein S16
MIKIRLARFGKKNDPFYRIVAIDESKKRNGQSIAKLGFWHPRTNDLQVLKDEISDWKSRGAQITSAVNKLLEQKPSKKA